METTVVIGVRSNKSKSSLRAVQWVLKNNHIHHIDHIILIHVIPPITSIPTPSGKHIMVMDMDADLVSIYRQDMKSKCDDIFLPFKRLCKTKQMETLLLEDENPADALLRYISEKGCKYLVLGSSSSNYITRKLKRPDVPSTVLKFAPNTCNIYVVAGHKLLTKLENSLSLAGTSAGHDTQREYREGADGIDSMELHCDSVESKSNKTLAESPKDISDQSLQAYSSGGSSSSTLLEDTPRTDQLRDEIEQMQIELRTTLEMYDQACGDLVQVQNQVQSLTSECLEEARRVNDVVNREEMLRKFVAEKRQKYLEVTKEVEVSKQLFAKEAHERHKAELIALIETFKKQETLDALFSRDKRYRKYSRDEIEFATEFFSDAKKIGEGGYGKVYRCTLDNTPVAIKVLHTDACDKKQEFLREVEVLSQLRHPYLVLLLAACPEIGCLVYEYMENGSLEERLSCKNGTPPLPWFVRFRIACEVASGLAFLHSSKPEPIVHRDLKPGNILLDRNYVSKIGDVGLAELMSDVVPDNVTEYRDTIIAGTLCYMDPEYQRTGTVRPKSDVYAFGIIVLQLLTARHPKGLIMAVENAIQCGSFRDILDNSISDWPLAESEDLARIALRCSNLRCRDRPDLELEVLPILQKLRSIADSRFQLQKHNMYTPNHYFCPILQEIMNDPYIAADGFTYEHIAIKTWLEKYSVSPVTRLKLSHTILIPNNTLRSSIQNWRQDKSGQKLIDEMERK
ncbi:hypothetical protein AQUCO_02000417v1 [Aquilegia coerulea]|uniref:RING-type E3 ubiquitin transferase n=1 Tax=Aquilegia coerulea TaxID=218851 RepID=A0A2G5DHE2_AQUCA|nr:hypothetical protein AQUCO_02000417v1 [Aquilegia coerulea]